LRNNNAGIQPADICFVIYIGSVGKRTNHWKHYTNSTVYGIL